MLLRLLYCLWIFASGSEIRPFPVLLLSPQTFYLYLFAFCLQQFIPVEFTLVESTEVSRNDTVWFGFDD